MKRLMWVCCSIVVAGCSDANLDQLDTTLAEIRRAPGGQAPDIISPLPEPRPLDYRYAEVRSPFLAPESVHSQDAALLLPEASEFAPDQQRATEPLEQFQLQSLRLVGTLGMGGQRVALIASPDGKVTSVRVGNYLGSNHGRITLISSQEITLVERVFSQQQGWQERQAALAIDE
ncbi:pilus assembly protein PilP [Halomonas sp. GFAJ-1]|uniref:pilus assembly protein PilP n=1 Tax=Halomonas sp. GFAJ-1 TaxID=1118153 RepID=UPI00023A54B0|nr:pilus assembly protein PilP [Halomonas sp. GFAJ-1]AVI61261.1 pilus assembly protein PilP [Halomonas sp. GFAJ-1]EHK61929.1 pilus assembly protein PilQ [Halomonas sp. GFAJ-1]